MEKFTELFASSTGGTNLKAKVREVEDPFLHWRQRMSHHSDASRRSDGIDPPLRKLLDKLAAFFQWFAEDHPRRRDRFERTMTALDGSSQPLSPALVTRNWKVWKEIREYFVLVSHHRKFTDLITLRQRIDELETFLADRLLPRTAEDWDVIDDLIKEARDA